MKIAITTDPEIPVPPVHYGGIERVVDLLVSGLQARGHEVTLFAHPDSRANCKRVPYPGQSSFSKSDVLRNMMTVAREVLFNRYQIVHSFGRIAYLGPLLPHPIPKLMTYQRAIARRSVIWGHRLSRGTLHFSAISTHMTAAVRDVGDWHLVFNGVEEHRYQFSAAVPSGAPLVFLGRIEQIKGVHLAIEVARNSGRKLVIAGNLSPGREHQQYFIEQVQPFVDGDHVQYIGPVDDAQKNQLLGSAAAFLMPILWEEPFGIVMAEALACGTPVVGLRRGSVPEIVEHGKNGYVCDSVAAMVAAVHRIDRIDRAECRRGMERRFSSASVVAAYEAVYREISGGWNATGARSTRS